MSGPHLTMIGGIASLELLLSALAGGLRLVLELLSVLCVALGLLATLRLALPSPWRRRHRPATGLRLTFASWLSMALEFQLGADIVSTTTAPSGANLIQLAAVAVIRTFLNLFLAREIEAEQRLEGERQTLTPTA